MFLFITLGEARKQFKTYVNILSTIKNEGKEKFLILRKKYVHECPTEDNLSSLSQSGLMSPGSRSTISEFDENTSFGSSSGISAMETSLNSPFREPPPYKPPPPVLGVETKDQYKVCVDEFKSAINAFESRQLKKVDPIVGSASVSERQKSLSRESSVDEAAPVIPPRKRSSASEKSVNDFVKSEPEVTGMFPEDNKENDNGSGIVESGSRTGTLEKQISVKEATKKFNLIVAEEEAKVITSPPAKKKPEKVSAFFSKHVPNYLSSFLK